jgi:exodeoxyribonuclease V beta subunit
MSVLDPLAIPTRGVHLIEASAGTGKTYTIATLFVRLVVERGLDVNQILVVTFTNAATAELRDRIRKRLRDALTAFEIQGIEVDPLLARLVDGTPNRELARARLARALEGADQASVFTIHGFCQRVLQEHAFDGGVRFGLDLVPNIEPFVAEITQDFWNVRIANARRVEVEYLKQRGIKFDDFAALALVAARAADAPIVTDGPVPDLDGALRRYFEARRRLAREWSIGAEAVRRILDTSPALNRRRGSYSVDDCRATLGALAALVSEEHETLAGFSDDLRKLGAQAISANPARKSLPPEHPVFFACDDLVDAYDEVARCLDQWVQCLKEELARHVRRELPIRTSERQSQSFDDLLFDLGRALRGPRGRALAAAVRRRHPAALIDEFHDTDPLQYEIFRRIHGNPSNGTALFLIGDPKQAIYAFRGADVFAYLRAASDASGRYTLATNYRSDPSMVRAVNTLFSRPRAPFVFEDIRFEPVGTPPSAEDALLVDGAARSGLEILFVPRVRTEDKKSKAPSVEIVPGIVASEIVRLLGSGAVIRSRGRDGKIRERGLEAGDIAVLTRRNAEALEIQDALRALGVVSVLQGDASVLDTEEARESSLILKALADPTNATSVRSALATSLLGLDATELFELGEDESAWERWTTAFALWHSIWKERGFLPAIRRLARDLSLSARILGTVGGERRLTNFLHLTEILHGQATDRHLGMAGLIAWFDEVRVNTEARRAVAPETQQVRLESDARAVQLTTMHRSKGLEYPVVVLPYLFRSASLFKRDKQNLRYHDPAKDHALVVDVRPEEAKAEPIALAEQEALAEGLRLAYVALTRAKHRTIAIWGPFRDWEKSALAHLLNPGHPLRPERDADSTDDVTLRRDLEALAEAAGGAIEIREYREQAVRRYPGSDAAERPLAARTTTRRLSLAFRTSSFTALVAGGDAREGPLDDGRDVEQDARGEEAPLRSGPPRDDEPILLDQFPRGPRAGNALHAILEELDFELRDEAELPRRTRDQLSRHGLDADAWTEPVCRALRSMLETPLREEGSRVTLLGIPRKRRKSEMEFTFPAGDAKRSRTMPLTGESLARVLRRREGTALPRGYADSVAALGFAPLAGFLRGFIDLVFEHDGRFYVVDYKSNHLGPVADAYRASALVRPMAHHHYFLQYHLYTVAVHRHLQGRVPDYDYDAHFGGVFYLFLRGMSADRGPRTGVFFDRPQKEAVLELSRAIGGVRRTS